MRIADIYKGSGFPLSYEIFPPKGDLNIEELRTMLDALAGTNPSFISVTCSAGGSGNSANTARLSGVIEREYHIPSMAHITCMGYKVCEIDAKAEEIKSEGIENVLALRGDPTPAAERSELYHASELIEHLHGKYNFCVGAGCYPEGHVDCESVDRDIDMLKLKEDAGAEFFVSQLFFDNESFYRFIDKARSRGISVPIDAGIMPIMSKSQITRMIFTCGASLPAAVVRLLYKYENDHEALFKAGLEYAANQITDLAASGAASGIHLYSMNKPEVAVYETRVLRNAGF